MMCSNPEWARHHGRLGLTAEPGLRKDEAVIPRERDNRAAPSAIFFKKPKAILRLARRRAFPLGRAISVMGGNSEVSALREFFAV
jgi:hypothetical protein